MGAMNEVSCQVLDVFFQRARRERVPVGALVAGVEAPLSHLTNRHARIDWDTFRAFMGNAGRVWSREQLVEIGESFFASPALKTMSLVSRLLFTGPDFYRWVFDKQNGIGSRGFSCVAYAFEQLDELVIALELRVKPGFPPCPEFFAVCEGNFRGMPRALGLASARVVMTPLENGARYLVEVPPGGGLLPRLKRSLTRPFSAVAVARALQEANVDLLTRNQELSNTRSALAEKTARLEVVNRLGHELARNTQLEGLAAALSKAFAQALPRLALRVYVSDERGEEWLLCESEPLSPSADAEEAGLAVAGTGAPFLSARTWALTSGDEQVGRLEVSARVSSHEAAANLLLLDDLIPWVSIAVGNARSFGLLREYRDELSQKVDERTSALNSMMRELEQSLEREREALRQRSEFFDNVSHELRTPLTLILLTVESLQEPRLGLGEFADRHLDRLQRSAVRLLRLINDLLDLAKLEAGKLRLRYADVSLPDLLEEMLVPFRVQAEQKGLKLSLQCEPGVETILADPERLDMVFQNLIGNALKFTHAGEVVVRVSQGATSVKVEVCDTGPGISAEDQKKLFQRFAQTDADGVRRLGGTGIGLALVREMVELHEGTVSVRSTPGEGSTFEVILPRGSVHVKEPLTGEPPPQQAPPGARVDLAEVVALEADLQREEIMPPAAGAPSPLAVAVASAPGRELAGAARSTAAQQTVLLVEDDEEIRTFLSELLGERYQVLTASDGAEGLAVARARRPALVVSDVMMPVMSGLTLLAELRASADTADLPVILLTARQELSSRVSGLEIGASDYISKPFSPRELLARVDTQLRLREATARIAQTERLAATSLLTSGFAHEVRNPLNGLINSLAPLREAVKERPDPVLASAMIDVVEESVGRVKHLAESLLAMVRTTPDRVALDVPATVRAAVRSLQWKVPDGVTIAQEHAVELPVIGDAGSLTQVWINLVDNALRAVGAQGCIRLDARSVGDEVVVEVTDDGCGMPPEAVERAFEPFYSTRTAGEGTGLGLPLCRRIVLQHGGQIEVRSEAGRGTTVTVRLPAVDPALPRVSA